MSKHEKIYEAAKEAINELFSDTSVGQSTTATDLRTLIEEIDMMLDTLKEQEDE